MKWNNTQKDIVNYSTIPMTEFVNDINEAHQSELRKIQLKIDRYKELLVEQENKMYLDVAKSVKKEFPIFSFLKGNKEEGEFILHLAQNRKPDEL